MNEIEEAEKRLEELREKQKKNQLEIERMERRAHRKAEIQAALVGIIFFIVALVLYFNW